MSRFDPEEYPDPGGPPPPGEDELTAEELAEIREATESEVQAAANGARSGTTGALAAIAGTKAALRDGIITFGKAQIIASLTALLDPAEARKAEAMVLGRAGRLTPGGLRSAIAHAVKDVAADKAKKRREEAARDARVQRWAEDSGNAALMGRELPTAEVLAADQRITAWARRLKKAGIEGDMDLLRARAYLDLLLGKDSRPRQDAPGDQDTAGGPAGSPAAGTTGSRPRATTPGPSCGTWPRSGTPPAPARSAAAPPPPATSSTTPLMKQAAEPVCAMAVRRA
jgi:hypothetical protein